MTDLPIEIFYNLLYFKIWIIYFKFNFVIRLKTFVCWWFELKVFLNKSFSYINSILNIVIFKNNKKPLFRYALHKI